MWCNFFLTILYLANNVVKVVIENISITKAKYNRNVMNLSQINLHKKISIQRCHLPSSGETQNKMRTKRDITKQIYILFFHYTRNGISLGMPTEKSVRDFFLTRKMTVEFVCREVCSLPYNIRHSQRRGIIKLMSSALLAPRSVPSNPTPALFSLGIYSMCFYLLF